MNFIGEMNITKAIIETIDPDLDTDIENQPKILEGTRKTPVRETLAIEQKVINLPKAGSSLDNHHQRKGLLKEQDHLSTELLRLKNSSRRQKSVSKKMKLKSVNKD